MGGCVFPKINPVNEGSVAVIIFFLVLGYTGNSWTTMEVYAGWRFTDILITAIILGNINMCAGCVKSIVDNSTNPIFTTKIEGEEIGQQLVVKELMK